ncbi:MAG TPA: VWA domain-containing protein [Bryobacterales bacterium]|nr:VWA domain-containing protein [Bryobacterales bacterium]
MIKLRRSSAAFLLFLLAPLFGQSPVASFDQTRPNDYRFLEDVNLVVLGVAVLERDGGFATGLSKDDFKIYENGRPQQMKFFHAEDVPVDVGLVVDGSGSMRPKRSETIEAALSFIQYSNPKDEMFVINFNEKVYSGLLPPKLFTDNVNELQSALVRSPDAGRTALYDAIAAGLGRLGQGSRDKKVLIVFSDGGDNASRRSLRDVLKLAEQSDAIIYAIGLFDEQDHDRNPGVLKRLARLTGGEAYLPNLADAGRDRDLDSICRRIAKDIRNQYTIGYLPSTEGAGYRTIKVVAEAPGRRKLFVRTRAGYTPPAANPQSP